MLQMVTSNPLIPFLLDFIHKYHCAKFHGKGNSQTKVLGKQFMKNLLKRNNKEIFAQLRDKQLKCNMDCVQSKIWKKMFKCFSVLVVFSLNLAVCKIWRRQTEFRSKNISKERSAAFI